MQPNRGAGLLGAAIGSHGIVVEYSEFAVFANESAHELLHCGSDRPEFRDNPGARGRGGSVCRGPSDRPSGRRGLARPHASISRGRRGALGGSLERVQRTAASILRSTDVREEGIARTWRCPRHAGKKRISPSGSFPLLKMGGGIVAGPLPSVRRRATAKCLSLAVIARRGHESSGRWPFT
jgi:hypothetical protein